MTKRFWGNYFAVPLALVLSTFLLTSCGGKKEGSEKDVALSDSSATTTRGDSQSAGDDSGVFTDGTGTANRDGSGACVKDPDQVGGETKCSDHKDNDCYGGADCQDSACLGKPCNTANASLVCQTGGSCAANPPICHPTAASETAALCHDGLNNDCLEGADCEGDAKCKNATKPCVMSNGITPGTQTCADREWGACVAACTPGTKCGDCAKCGQYQWLNNCTCDTQHCTNQKYCDKGTSIPCGNCGTTTCANNCEYYGACVGKNKLVTSSYDTDPSKQSCETIGLSCTGACIINWKIEQVCTCTTTYPLVCNLGGNTPKTYTSGWHCR